MLWPDNDAALPPAGTSHTTKLCAGLAELSDIAVGGPWRNPESCHPQATGVLTFKPTVLEPQGTL